MRPADTWVCVADGRRAQFYRCDGPGCGLVPMLDYAFVTNGRGSGGVARAGAAAQPLLAVDVAGEDERSRFLGRVAGQLDRAADGRLFAHLVLVAPSHVLGALRGTLRPETRQLVVGEVDKDLTHATPRELVTHVGGTLPH
ncbi:MAG: host attachment protein [Magnetospirillum sp.]|nr:host attachment protein [Magnetospirillum sp.]